MYIILVLIILIVISTITAGIVMSFRKHVLGQKNDRHLLKFNLSAFISTMTMAIIMLIPQVAHAATDGAATNVSGLGLIAAAVSTGLATVGAGIAVGSVGSSALGAVSEDPKMLGKTLIFVGLAEGIAIYGLVISIIILGRI